MPAYLQTMVHEVKASWTDLLSDQRHDAKRQAYQAAIDEARHQEAGSKKLSLRNKPSLLSRFERLSN
ncbi:hypothetical protein LJR129_002935 [Acidovorax sp. LjRoot129]|uniref:hypothetical protein n=1 Tax=Acidovorax sp. LjRoot129 TaxID=3342260 RepID=UPI003ECDB5EE